MNGEMPINSTIEQLKMAFNHPVKEVIWTIQKDSLINTTHLTLREAIANVDYEYSQRGWSTYSYYEEHPLYALPKETK